VWILFFICCVVSGDFPMLREIKEGHLNLACKVIQLKLVLIFVSWIFRSLDKY
jgi:hypothetical protein